MASAPWDPRGEALTALRAIAADPQYGAEALSSAQMMTNLLKDMLPDAPREANVLITAAGAGVPTALQGYLAQGMDAGTATQLAAGVLADRTALTADACAWATSSLATALLPLAAPPQASVPAGTAPLPGSDHPTMAPQGTGPAAYGPGAAGYGPVAYAPAATLAAGRDQGRRPASASRPRPSPGRGRWPRSWPARSRSSISTTRTAPTRVRSPCSASAAMVPRGTGSG